MLAKLPIPLQKKLTRTVSQCSIAWHLIEPNDRIMVAFSGGKDSILLIHLLDVNPPMKSIILAIRAPICFWLSQQNSSPFLLAAKTTDIVNTLS